MTVSTILNKIIYVADGATTSFTFSFPGVSASDIQIYQTDLSGNTTLLASNRYTVVLNPAIAPNPTGIGGSINFLVPPTLNFLITILRFIPLTQPTSLANQGTLYQPVIETSLDNELMQIQQLYEVLNRNIAVAVSDPNPAPLPAVAARAGLWAAFDSSGNMIAATAPSGGVPISAPMQPVVNAATLALARTAMGLGTTATEGIGGGLQDDGAGNLRVFIKPVSDVANQAVTSAFFLNERIATGALTYTHPASATLWNGFSYWIYALNNYCTLAINAADAFVGMPNGAAILITPGSKVFVSTNGAGLWYIEGNLALTSLTYPVNLSLLVSVAGNALTIAIKELLGNDPSSASPVVLSFRSPSITGGDAAVRTVTSALSITVPNGASLGSLNGVPCRVWVVAFDNNGTVVPGVIVCATTAAGAVTGVFPLNAASLQTGTAISAAANTAGTFYSASGVASKAFCILGYIEATEATAGVWATSPSKVQLIGPGVKRPGDIIQTVWATDASAPAGTGAFANSGLAVTLTPTSGANILQLNAGWQVGGNIQGASLRYARTATLFGPLVAVSITVNGTTISGAIPAVDYNLPVVATTWNLQFNTGGTAAFNFSGGSNTITATEIQV